MNFPKSIDVVVDVVDGMRDTTLHVKFNRVYEFKLRTWLATRLFFSGAWLLNCNIEFDFGDGDSSDSSKDDDDTIY